MANLKSGTLIGGNMIWNAGNMPFQLTGNTLTLSGYKVYTENDKPTASDVNAVSKTGDTMTGDLTINKTNGKIRFTSTVNDSLAGFFFTNGANQNLTIDHIIADGSLPQAGQGLKFYGNGHANHIITDGDFFAANNKKVYHQGFKPTPVEVGAVAIDGSNMMTGALKIKAPSTHIQLYESDQSDKRWNIELQNTNLQLTEHGVSVRAKFLAGGGTELSGTMVNNGEVKAKASNCYRIYNGTASTNIGSFFRNDNTNFYLMFTEAGQAESGGWNTLRPFAANLTTGLVTLANGVYVGSSFKANCTVYSERNNAEPQVGIKRTGTDVSRTLYLYDSGNNQGLYSAGVAGKSNISLIARSMTDGGVSVGNSGFLTTIWGTDLKFGSNKIYHQGFKPTAGDVGAAVSSGTGASDVNNNLVAGFYNVGGNAPNWAFSGNGGSHISLNHGNNYVTQIAAEGNSGRLRVRAIQSGTWLPWVKIYNEREKPTAADVGAVSKTGDTMSGTLTTSNVSSQFRGGAPSGDLDVNNLFSATRGDWSYTPAISKTSPNIMPSSNNANGVLTFNTHQGDFYHQIGFSSNSALYHRNGKTAWGKIYTQNQKPTARELSIGRVWGDSDYANGTLIETNIDASATDGESFTIDIIGKSYLEYSDGSPIHLMAEGYMYGGKFITTTAIVTGSPWNAQLTYLKMSNGKLGIWFPRQKYWNNYGAYVWDTRSAGVKDNRVVRVINSAKPSSDKTIDVNVHRVYSTINKPTAGDVGAVNKAGDTMTGGLVINNSAPTMRYQDTDGKSGFIHVNSNNFYVLRSAGNNGTTFDNGPNGRHPMTLSLDSGNATFSNTVIGNYNESFAYAAQNTTKAAFYHEYTTGGTSEYHPLVKIRGIRTGGETWTTSLGQLISGTTISETTLHMIKSDGTARNWSFRNNGDFNSPGNVIAYSDIRVKTDVKTIENALDTVCKLRGVTYKRTDIEGDVRHMGFIAQEAEKHIPEVVSTSKVGDIEDFKGIAYGNVVALLVEGMKELKEINSELLKRIEMLESAK